jgi:DNA-directed RNA polymerase specialized sigma24 family protein
MRSEGFHVREIARAANKSHPTISIQTNKIREIIQERNPSWKQILRIWDKLQEELKEDEISEEALQFENKLRIEKEHLIRRIVALPKEDRMEIILAVQDSMSITEINDEWETNTTIDQ